MHCAGLDNASASVFTQLERGYQYAREDDDMEFWKEAEENGAIMPNGFTPFPPLDLEKEMNDLRDRFS